MNPRDFRTRRRIAPAQSGQGLALHCAERVALSVDRRMPEAGAIADWLGQNGAGLGLPEMELPDEPPPRGKRTVGVPAPAWRRVLSAIASAVATLPEVGCAPADLWIAALGERLGYDPLERAILSLAIHYQLDERVERLVDGLCLARGTPTQLSLDPALLGLLLAADPAEIDMRLRGEAILRASGILRVDRDGSLGPIHPLQRLVRSATPPLADLYDQLLGATTAVPLPWDAFEHLGQQAVVAADLLRAALAGREGGINVLLYGPPGTGKTSFAATLAARVGARLRPVTEEDSWGGGEPTRHERLSGLRLAQRLAPPGETLLLFDEAEDVFVSRSMEVDELAVSSRVFMHRLLEVNATPVIWTANDIGMLGPASLRRMTMCLELGVPGVAVRTRLWRRMGQTEGVALDDAEAAGLARLVPAAPAVASIALRATRLVRGDAGTARLIVEGIARAVAGGHAPPAGPEADAQYDPALLNADQDLVSLADRLVRPGATRAVSLLLSGPSGTGKSAWVHHLAARMGLEVVQKRASDLLGPFVGETEQRIAAAFAQARQDGAFLLFDEADSLLAERGNAVRTWESSQVNEMLTWMEQHPLPFACTTNLPDKLDRASLRRFLVKVRLDWLTAAQARVAFTRFYAMPPPAGLDDLRTLTPADFALVRRRAALTGEAADAAALLALLAAESADRIGGRSRLGFGARDAV